MVMTSQPDAKFVQDDTSRWVFTLTDATGAPVDLTGATVRIHMVQVILNRPLIFDQAAVVDQTGTDPNFVSKGQVHYDPRVQDVAVAGEFLVEFEVTVGSKTLTYPQGNPIYVRIRPDFA